jgi:hypothetical protein
MEPSEAAELLTRCAKLESPSQEVKMEVESIVKELGYLALAINLAGSYISATPRLSSDIRQYLPEYRERRKELLAEKPKRFIHYYRESVLTTWESSFSAIRRQSPQASRFMTLLAFLHFDDIFLDLFSHAMSNKERMWQGDAAESDMAWQRMISPEKPMDSYMVEAAFRTLESYSLVQSKPDQK